MRTILLLAAAIGAPTPCLADVPIHHVRRARGTIQVDGKLNENDWRSAQPLRPFVFPWWKAGKKEQTQARLLFDDKYLYVSYVCTDAHISATRQGRDSRVYMDDCVEIFIAPKPGTAPLNYFNFEMNAGGSLLDQHHPTGPGPTKKEWNSRGVKIAVKIDGTLNNDKDIDRRWTLEAAIPWSNFRGVAVNLPPQPGDVWKVNLNRCGGVTNQQYSQWTASRTKSPQFHAPRDFGRLTFEAAPQPTTRRRPVRRLLRRLFR